MASFVYCCVCVFAESVDGSFVYCCVCVFAELVDGQLCVLLCLCLLSQWMASFVYCVFAESVDGQLHVLM